MFLCVPRQGDRQDPIQLIICLNVTISPPSPTQGLSLHGTLYSREQTFLILSWAFQRGLYLQPGTGEEVGNMLGGGGEVLSVFLRGGEEKGPQRVICLLHPDHV